MFEIKKKSRYATLTDFFSCINMYKDVNATFITGMNKQLNRFKNNFSLIIEIALIR